eukprot:XP_003976226.2 PREDICTED: protein FAM134B isoform X2 [Takifugu rubripes]
MSEECLSFGPLKVLRFIEGNTHRETLTNVSMLTCNRALRLGAFTLKAQEPEVPLNPRCQLDALRWRREAAASSGRSPTLMSRETRTAGARMAVTAAMEPPSQAAREQDAPCGRAGGRVSGVISWQQRPCTTSALFAAANALFGLLAFSSFRLFSILAILLALLVVMATSLDFAGSRSAETRSWCIMTASWEIIDPGRDGQSGPAPQPGDSLRLFLQETSAFKQQNPGKFCLLVCSLCTFLAVLGRYVPGMVLSYVLVLGVFLWPLISPHDVSLWLKPVLQRLDFGVGEFLQKIKENHERRLSQARREHETIESDLSSMFPKLDSTVCKEMSVSDTDASDVTWTDNGTFNLSEGHTPQTENSEDLDREEPFTGGLPEFPSLDNGTTTNGDGEDDLSLDLPSSLPRSEEPVKPRQTPPAPGDQPADRALELVTQIAGDVITATVTAAIQEKINAAVALATGGNLEGTKLPGSSRLLELVEESDSEVEDFELLDQSELERLEGELGLGGGPVRQEVQAPGDKPDSTGFFSKLLRRH